MTFCRGFLATFALALLTATACTPAPDNPGKGGGGDDDEGGSGAGGKRMGGAGGTKTGGRGGTPAGGAGGMDQSGGSSGADAAVPDGGGGAEPDCTAALPKSLFCDPLQTMPKTIKETGIFPAAPDFTKHAAGMRGYTPDPPLWSDGMEKERFMLLPAGKKIDNSDPTKWVFPVGTIFIKTFFDDGGPMGKPRPIETRFIRRVGDETAFKEYDFYLYQWNDTGTDAMLVVDDRNGDEMASPTVKITINRIENGKPLVINKGQPFDHNLPSRFMCGGCHLTNGILAHTFIGFDDIRLNWTRKAGDTSQLAIFQNSGLFMKATKPTNPPPRTVEDPDPLLRRIKRFVFGNCVHCHNAKGMAFDQSPDVFVKNVIGMKTDAQTVEPPMNWLRVVPGDPESSVLFVQVRRTPLPPPVMMGGNSLRPMPPYGVADMAPDQDAVADLKTWILGLKK